MTSEEMMKKTCLEYEKKLKELMEEKEFRKYVQQVAERLFREDIEGMADGDFKDFVLANWRNIVGGVE